MVLYLSVDEQEKTICANHGQIADASREATDYDNTVCVKPWGHEFLVYRNNKVAIWFLRVNQGHSTSLHCHFKKDTLLTTLAGVGKIRLVDDSVLELPVLESIFIPREKFHALSTFSEYVYFLEIEIFDDSVTFSDKNDLLRIDDIYKRNKTGYESSIKGLTTSDDLTSYGHFALGLHRGIQNVFGTVMSIDNRIPKLEESCDTISIILKGKIYHDGKILKEGTVLSPLPKTANQYQFVDKTVELLHITRPYYLEDRKIIHNLAHLQHVTDMLATSCDRVVLTSGCFDIIHVGHLHHLKAAKQLGDTLMVCLSNDTQISKLKGESRPINNYEDRINLFKTITYVDYIILYDEKDIETEETLGQIMKTVKPYTWTKGDDYTSDTILAKHPYLSNIHIIPNIKNHSTTTIVNKIQKTT